MIKGNSCNDKQQYDIFKSFFRRVLDKHAPLKIQKPTGNQAKFMTKELRKAIKDRSKLKSKYLKWSSLKNFLTYKKVKNICNSLNNKAKKDHFKKATADGVVSNTKFWNTVKPFLTSKGFLIVENKQKLTKEFDSYYINIAKTTSGKPPMKLENNLDYNNDSLITKRIIKNYKNHPSIKAIQDTFSVKKEYKLKKQRLSKLIKF